MDRITADRLRELVDEHGAALVLYARQWSWAPEDALQEALIELARQRPVPDQPLAWLFLAVRRRAMNFARGEICRLRHQRQAAEQRETWFDASPEAGLESAELAGMLDQLPPLEREIVIARIWGQLPYAQIAELVQISCSATHRRYHQALTRLGEMMDQTIRPDDSPQESLPESSRSQP